MKIQTESIIYPLPDDTLLERVEGNLEVKFPSAFCTFIKKNNGAIPITKYITYKNNRYVVERFLCILDNRSENSKGMYDIKVVFSQLDERMISNGDLTSSEIVPFAALYAGDFVCIDYQKNQTSPEICIWYHEDSGEFEPVTEKIANNMNEFFEMLSE
ncbi:SMI1/KNR4 family protein [Bacillus sp. DX4.1]|uniref:SMI1/KNR4 family protein n=1 Tax=Bacillus sp. DX4.1 TaxID=3055867 RepID=UPI0025A2D7AA|nr:SMI1/KNR4 family protein [Bacillus sp. DX4.1]MDM5186415.1 SMI1/KNR4 family protein [Bacillus sp. DX4.1]